MHIAKYECEEVGRCTHVRKINMEGQAEVLAVLSDTESAQKIVDELNHLLRQTKATWNTTWNRIMRLVTDPTFQYNDEDLDACSGIGLDDFNGGYRKGITTREASAHVRWQSMNMNGTIDQEELKACISYMRDKIYLID